MEAIKDLFERKLDELKRRDYRKYRILAGELFEWGAAISPFLGGNGNLGDLVEHQIKFIANDTKMSPKELVSRMFNDYIGGNDYAFTGLFHHFPNTHNNYALKRG